MKANRAKAEIKIVRSAKSAGGQNGIDAGNLALLTALKLGSLLKP